MCGFTGFLDPLGRIERYAALRDMTRMLERRGPDGEGFWVDDEAGVALGHRRLAIIDLSPTGHQPMASPSRRFVVAFNGEIYNFRDLRVQLQAQGFEFHGTSDTEVLLAAVEAWGLFAAVKRFVGMFAFALWDREARELHLVRDRLGEKPLYFGWVGPCFMFGSELKALRAHPAWKGEISRDSLALLMRHNYIGSPHSIYQGISKLAPGTILTMPLGTVGEEPRIEPYWSLDRVVEQGLAKPFEHSESEAVARLEALLTEAVELQMVADVPIGAFLSGGIDSSLIVALMQKQSARAIKTFTIGFQESSHDEAPYAAAVAKHLGTDHTSICLTPSEAMSVIPHLPRLFDEPFSDSSQIPTVLVSQLARQHVTVSLSGDAGDELFGGYTRYQFCDTLWRRVSWLPKPLRAGTAKALRRALSGDINGTLQKVPRPHYARDGASGKLAKLADLLETGSAEALYQRFVSHWLEPDRLVLGAQEPKTPLRDEHRIIGVKDFRQYMMYLDTLTYLPDDILTKVDRAAMGSSLETRVPFLDHRVVEFAWQLPISMQIQRGEGKWLLRQMLYQFVPKTLLDRPKTGFGVPLGDWLRGPLREWAEDLLDERRMRDEGYFDTTMIALKWEEHLSGAYNWQHVLWDVLVFQAWLREQKTNVLHC